MNTTKWKLIGLAASATAIVLAPIASAQPGGNGNGNGNGNGGGNHGNQNPPGRSVSAVAGNGPAAVLGVLASMKPDNPGLPNALSHVPAAPTPTTTETTEPSTAPSRGASGVAGQGPGAILGWLQQQHPDNPGLPNAASHVPTTSPSPTP